MLQFKLRIAVDRIHRSSHLAAIFLDPLLLLSGVKQMRARIWIHLGLQSFRMHLAEILFKKSLARKNSKIGIDSKKTIDDTGLLAYENFLCDATYQNLREEVREFKQTVKPNLDQTDNTGGNYRVWNLHNVDQKKFPTLSKLILNGIHKDVLTYIQGFTPPNWQYAPVLQETSWNMDMSVDDPNCHFHSDYFTHTAKGFYFIDEVTVDGAPFEYVLGSHVFDSERIRKEGRAFKIGSNESLRLDVGAADVRSMTVPGNTLLFADTGGLHRRRPPENEKSRTIIYFNGGGQKPTFLRRLFG